MFPNSPFRDARDWTSCQNGQQNFDARTNLTHARDTAAAVAVANQGDAVSAVACRHGGRWLSLANGELDGAERRPSENVLSALDDLGFDQMLQER